MGYKALYRTYRPKSFNDVVGQDAIVTTLKHAIETDKIAHAYLFAGPRGTGKTTIAKLLAKAINCLEDNKPCNHCQNCTDANEDKNPDIIEIDAASNNGVDQIRGIIDQVKYPPMQSKYKVYIIDEVHMLSTGAFNALLKTLEEPPTYVVFILATTEPHKVLPTIISRCQRYDFRKVDHNDMKKRLVEVLDKENVKYEDAALEVIISLADGGMRDALSILDQCLAYDFDCVTLNSVTSVYGLTTIETKINLVSYIQNKDVSSLLTLIDKLDNNGVDLKRLISDLLELFKQATCYLYTNDMSLVTLCDQEKIENLVNGYAAKSFLDGVDVFLKTLNDLKFANDTRSYFEVACLKCIEVFNKDSVIHETKEVNIAHEETKTVDNRIISSNPVNAESKVTNIEAEETSNDNLVIRNDDIKLNDVSRETLTTQSVPSDDTVIKPVEESKKDYDDDFLLSLLAGAEKTCKFEDESRYQSLDDFRIDIESGRLINYLKACQVYASNDKFILLASNDQDIVDSVNDDKINCDLEKFYYKSFLKDKRFYAFNSSRGNELRNKFSLLYKSNSLPPKYEVKVRIIGHENSESIEDKLRETFKDKLEIVEE